MKKRDISLLIPATFAAGAVFVMLGLTTFTGTIPGDKLMAVAFSAALLHLGAWDYARRAKILRKKLAPLLRPALPVVISPAIKGTVIYPRPDVAERTVA